MLDAPRILIAEDDPLCARVTTAFLHAQGFEHVDLIDDGAGARAAISTQRYDLVITDIGLPGASGLDLVRHIRATQARTPVIVMTATPTVDYAVEALTQKADAFLTKPFSMVELGSHVDTLLTKRRDARKTVLAISAHPDDAEIGCGASLLRHRAEGHDIVHVLATRGAQGGDQERRTAEARRAADLLGARLVIGDLTDTRVTDGPETIALIEEAIRAYQPDVVYTHSANDVHQDHRSVHRATLVAARNVPNVFCYQSPSTTIDFRPTLFADAGEFFDAKLDLLDAYGSQTAIRGYLDREVVRATGRYWSRFSSCEYAEPFEVVRQRS